MAKVHLQLAVRRAMRRRLFIVVPGFDESRLQLPNTVFHRPKTGIWIRESINEGSEEPISNAAARAFVVVNYEVFGPAARGADEVDAAVEAIRRALPVVGDRSLVYEEGRQSAIIRSIDKPAGGIDNAEPTWYRRLVAVTVELYNP